MAEPQGEIDAQAPPEAPEPIAGTEESVAPDASLEPSSSTSEIAEPSVGASDVTREEEMSSVEPETATVSEEVGGNVDEKVAEEAESDATSEKVGGDEANGDLASVPATREVESDSAIAPAVVEADDEAASSLSAVDKVTGNAEPVASLVSYEDDSSSPEEEPASSEPAETETVPSEENNKASEVVPSEEAPSDPVDQPSEEPSVPQEEQKEESPKTETEPPSEEKTADEIAPEKASEPTEMEADPLPADSVTETPAEEAVSSDVNVTTETPVEETVPKDATTPTQETTSAEASADANSEKPTEAEASEPMDTSSTEKPTEEVSAVVTQTTTTGTDPIETPSVPADGGDEDIMEVDAPRKSEQIAKDIADAGPSSGRVPRRAALRAETNIRNFARGTNKVESDDEAHDADFRSSTSSRKSAAHDAESVFNGKNCLSCSKNLRRTPNTLFWEAMEFCNASCLEKNQKKIGSVCAKCRKKVIRTAMGKYCVRFGASVRQFCSNPCLEEFKRALKVCAYCQLDISEVPGAFTASVGDKGQKDFCSKWCKNEYGAINGIEIPKNYDSCSVCSSEKQVQFEVVSERGAKPQPLCSDPCLTAFKFARGCNLLTCKTCKKLVDEAYSDKITIAVASVMDVFCSKTCGNVHVLSSRKIVPCGNCKVKKYNYDMIEKPAEGGSGSSTYFCSLNCFEAYVPNKSNGTDAGTGTGLRIASVASLQSPAQMPVVNMSYMNDPLPEPMPQKMMVRPPPRAVRNKAIICKPSMTNKGVNTRSTGSSTKETQTDDNMGKPVLIPVPIPIYVPSPMAMYNAPFPVPFVFPLPVPVPIFMPTTKKTTARIAKDIKKILKKIPSDPLEAELLMMAQAVGETRKDDSSSSSEEEEDDYDDVDNGGGISEEENEPHQNGQVSRMSGEDILQTALRSAVADDSINSGGYMPEPTIDVEQALAGTATAVTKSLDPPKRHVEEEQVDMLKRSPVKQQRKRTRSTRGSRGGGRGAKRSRMDDSSSVMENHNEPMPPPPEPLPPEERPDANMMLKFTFGVNAWRFWVDGKNKELEKLQAENPRRKIRLFKKDILQLSCEELCFALCYFVKEVKKPDGSQYSPDLVYYLCLGIQEYLLENSRVENIFNDQLFEKFTDCLDEVTRKFSGQQMLMELGYIMTHIEEEHLWEAKQLGAHSPHVLLNTLMYFTTKHFLLTTAKDHSRLSFPHVMKHWKKSPGPTGGRGGHQNQYNMGGQRNVLLKYYPPAAIRAEMGERAKRSYEMHENSENPLRCPIRLYEFYLSKCPESIKGKNEVFYLFPERSCVPHSPVWYSTQPLSEHVIGKMLNRISLVREIQDAIINDQ